MWAALWNLLQPVAVDEVAWWVEVAGWVVRVSVVVAAATLLMKTPWTRRPIVACLHWLWNNPAVTLTVEGFRDLVRDEIAPLRTELRDVATDVSALRRENTVQHEAVTDQLEDLSRTVVSNTERVGRVEDALMNRWRHGER